MKAHSHMSGGGQMPSWMGSLQGGGNSAGSTAGPGAPSHLPRRNAVPNPSALGSIEEESYKSLLAKALVTAIGTGVGLALAAYLLSHFGMKKQPF